MPELFANERDGDSKTDFLSAEKLLKFYHHATQTHLIPEFSLSLQDIVRHLQIFVFDSATRSDLAFLKSSGQKYQVITLEDRDMVFAILNLSQDDASVSERKLSKLI